MLNELHTQIEIFENNKVKTPIDEIRVTHELPQKQNKDYTLTPATYGLLYKLKLAENELSHLKKNEGAKAVSIADKYSLSIQEAAEYYGIGEKRLRCLISEHCNEPFILEIGTHVRIKRRLFEEFLDQAIGV